MIITHCAICGEKEKLTTLYPAIFDKKKLTSSTFSARRTPDRMHYQFVKCQRCGLIFSNPILPQEEITQLYGESTFSYAAEAEFLQKTYGNYLDKALGEINRGTLKLLDIGCGNGFFLQEAMKRGIKDVWGVEPGKESVNKAPQKLRNRIKVSIFKKALFPKNTFDIVTCFHTLDHIIDPNTFLHEVYTVLKPGGKALFILHNTNGLSVKLFGEKSPIFDIEHIYLFNKSTLARIFSQNQFKNTVVFDVKNTYPLSYWTRMLPLPKTVKNILNTFLRKSKIEKIPVSIQAGNIGIIAQK